MAMSLPTASKQVLAALAPAGTLRVALNAGNAALTQRDAASGEVGGVAAALARRLAEVLALPLQLVVYEAAGLVMAGLERGEWDLGFLAVDPVRAERLAFTPAYVQIAACYLVRADSPLRHPAQVDAPGHRVAVGRGAAYDLHLTRTLQQARIERWSTAAEAFAAFENEGLDAAAGVRRVVSRYAEGRPQLRVMDEDFLAIDQALCLPRRAEVDLQPALAWLHAFVEDAKRSGFVAEALAASGVADANVAPPAA